MRRYTPTSFVPLVAALAAQHPDKKSWFRPSGVRPWELAEVARVSLIHGTEFNRRAATEVDVLQAVNRHRQLTDPDLATHSSNAVRNFMLRTAAEQLTYQQDVAQQLSRSVAVFGVGPDPTAHAPKVLTEGWDHELLGASIDDYLRTAFLLHVAALQNEGRFNPGWLMQPNFARITQQVPAHVLLTVIDRNLVATTDELKEVQREAQGRAGAPSREYRRFGFNPLSQHPVVQGIADDWIIPVPHLLLSKASPLGVFYAGVDRWGNAFADDLGHVFQRYIGAQLSDVIGSEVIEEIDYGPRGQRQLSVDWIVIFNECVVLVEVKSTRPTEAVRWGGPTAIGDLQRMLSKGVNQLSKTAGLINDRHPAFREIPADRPIIGLLVTMESFHVVNMPFLASSLPAATIPYRICSAEEVEGLTRIESSSVGQELLDYLTTDEREGHSIKPLLEGRPLTSNRILDAAWARFQWGDDHPAAAVAGP